MCAPVVIVSYVSEDSSGISVQERIAWYSTNVSKEESRTESVDM